MFCGPGAPDWLDVDGSRCLGSRLVTAQEAIIAPFGGLLRRELGKPASDEAAPHAADEASAIGDELRFAAPMFWRSIETQRHSRVELGDEFVEDPVFGF